jgi:outer membrane protein assembly factor BamB
MHFELGIKHGMKLPFEGKVAGLVLGLAVFASAQLAMRAAADPLPGNWTTFRLNPSNNVVLDGTLDATWEAVTGGGISSSPTVSGNTLFIDNNAGFLNAIDLHSGRLLWRFHAANKLMSAPLLYDGLVIVGEGDETSASPVHNGPTYVGGGPSALLAFDQKTGRLAWSTAVAGSAMPTGAIIDGLLVEHNGAGWLTAVDPRTGKIRYTKYLNSIASMTDAVPIGSGRFLTLGVLDNAAFEVRAGDGSVVWRTPFSGAGSGMGDCPPVADGIRMYCDYVMPQSPGPYTTIGRPAVEHAYAIDLSTGKKLWDVGLQHGILPPRNEAAIPMLMDGVLYFGSSIAPWMHAADPATGHIVWQTKTHGPVKGGIVGADGVIYFGDLTGYLWALDAKTGAVIGDRLMPDGFNVGSPIVVGHTLIIGSKTGSVYALPLTTIRSSHDG